MTTKTPAQMDFSRIESIRLKLHLRKQDMILLLGCSRMAYYNWVSRGVTPTYAQKVKVRECLRRIGGVLTTHQWPSDAAIAATADERFHMFKSLFDATQQ